MASVVETVTETLEYLNVKNKRNILIPPAESGRLMSIGLMVDKLISEFDGESYMINIVPETLELSIDIYLPEMIVEDCSSHTFFDLIKIVDAFSFSVEEENVCLSVVAKKLFYYSE